MIERFLFDIFNCDLDPLPLEMKVNEFLFLSGSGWKDHLKCVNNTLQEDPRSLRHKCFMFIGHYCSHRMQTNLMNACNLLLKMALLPKNIATDWILNIRGQSIPDYINQQPKEFVLRYFQKYVDCMHSPKVASVINKCFYSVSRNCEQSNVMATKTIRLHMKDLEPMLQVMSYYWKCGGCYVKMYNVGCFKKQF